MMMKLFNHMIIKLKKITDIDKYSSKIATHHSKNELIEIIKKSNLLNHKDD